MPLDVRYEHWKTIEGYGGRYEINPHGVIRRVCKDKIVTINPYRNQTNWVVRLSYHGITRQHIVSRLVAAAFLPPPKRDDYVMWHKNGMLSDNYVGNLEWIPRTEMAKRAAALSGKRKPVAKIDQTGEVVEFYASARAAAAANYICDSSVLERCNGKTMNPFRLDGYSYAFDD